MSCARRLPSGLALVLSIALVGAAPAGAASAHVAAKHHRTLKHHHKKHHHHNATGAQSSPTATTGAPSSPAAATQTAAQSSPALAQPATGPCVNTDLQPVQANIDLARDATLCLINQVRAQHGLGALTVNATLEQIAQPYALKMVAENFFAHVTPAGQTPIERFTLSGYLPSLLNIVFHVGENLGWGAGSLSTPAAVVNAWVHSPVHLANILDTSFRQTAIGIAPGLPASLANGQAGATYTEEFGAIG